MNCNIINDLIPLYIDGCCSKESDIVVEEHIRTCSECAKLVEDMKEPTEMAEVVKSPENFSKLNDWKASVLQSILLFISFALITFGVTMEAKTPSGILNGFWAVNLIIPATGFMLSLANWYFVRVYKNRKIFSACSLIATLVIILCAYIWLGFHYEMSLFADVWKLWHFNGIGILLTVVFCVLSRTLSNQYAKMLGKE